MLLLGIQRVAPAGRRPSQDSEFDSMASEQDQDMAESEEWGDVSNGSALPAFYLGIF